MQNKLLLFNFSPHKDYLQLALKDVLVLSTTVNNILVPSKCLLIISSRPAKKNLGTNKLPLKITPI